MSQAVFGTVTINGRPYDGIEVRLYQHDAPFAQSPPEGPDFSTGFIGTPFPSGGLVATTTSGPEHGGTGAYTFEDVPAGAYYAGCLINGFYTWEPQQVVLASGVLSVAGPFSVSGALTLTQAATGNSVFLYLVTEVSGATGARIMELSPYHQLWSSGPDGYSVNVPARHWCGVWDKFMPSQNYGVDGSLGWPVFYVDADGQVHCQPKVRHTGDASDFESVNEMLILNAWVEGTPGVGFGDGLLFWAQRADGASTEQARIVTYWNKLTSPATGDCAVLEIHNTQHGVSKVACQFTSDGQLQITKDQRLWVGSTPDGTIQPMVMLGDGLFTGAAGSFSAANGCYLGMNASGSATADLVNYQVSGSTRFRLTPDGKLRVRIVDTVNNDVSSGLQIKHGLNTPTTGAVGMGAGVEFYVVDSAGNEVRAGQIATAMTSNAANAINSETIVASVSGGVIQNVLTLTPSGKALVLGGLGVGNAVSKTTLSSPGTVVKMVEIFDADGNSLGAVPVYSKSSFS